MTDALGQYVFLPWLREGVAAGASGGADPAGRVPLPLTLAFAGGDAAQTTLALYGPGDVDGIDPRQVIRTDPTAGASDFEPSYFPTVEFDEPSLPWLLSPQAPQGDRLTPWLCLVTVASASAELVTATPLPRLRVPVAELPDLGDAWAWAHAQVVLGGDTVEEVLAGHPERTLSRLVAPRKLAEDTAYLACVVPTYRAGVQAGLGNQPDPGLDPAWSLAAGGQVELPVYYSWTFSTSSAGTFETLARRLRPRELGPGVGLASLDVSAAGGGLPDEPGAVLQLEGALHSLAAAPAAWPDSWRIPFQQQLDALLAAPPEAADTTVTPPLYGSFQAAGAAGTPNWLSELNRDPRTRAAAGLGALVVRAEREQMLAGAWQQAGETRRANAVVRHAQLALAASTKLFEKRVRPLRPQTLLQLTQPAHARLPVRASAHVPAAGGTLRRALAATALPAPAASTAFRRQLGQGGAVGSRLQNAPAAALSLASALGAGLVRVPVRDLPDGTVTLAAVSAAVGEAGKVLANVGDTAIGLGGWQLLEGVWDDSAAVPTAAVARTRAAIMRDPGLPGDGSPILERNLLRIARLKEINGRFRTAASALQGYLGAPDPPGPVAPAVPPVDGSALATQLQGSPGAADGSLHPAASIAARAAGRIEGAAPGAELHELRIPVEFPQPMVQPLHDRAPGLLLPGADDVPADTVGALVENGAFVEAYLVGLNHELVRELLFADFPLDPQATAFRQFWDTAGTLGGGPDVPPIASWDPSAPLGAHASGFGAKAPLVLLIRGALVLRYPRLSVYAVEAAADRTPGTNELYPAFRGTLAPDMLFLGFALDVATARGDAGPGWYFVLQQQPTEPRFGLEPLRDANPRYGVKPTDWRNLSWGDLVPDANAYAALVYAPAQGYLGGYAPPGDTAAWGVSAAQTARIALQDPVRVAVHAAGILPEAGP